MKIKNNTGFNLIELVVVITIMAILLTIAVPNFFRWRDNSNLREVARNISSDILLNKQRASAENVRYRIIFNDATNNYEVRRESVLSLGNFATNLVVTKQVSPENPAIVMTGAANFGGNPFITFSPRGTVEEPVAPPNDSLTLQHTRRLSTATISANIMGRVNVQYVYK